MGGELDQAWFDVIVGHDPDRAKAEYDRYKLQKAARNSPSHGV